MSDLLIKGMEMPKEGEWISVNIFHDGKCFVQSWCGMDFNFAAKLTAVPVPPHGRLIDADQLKEYWMPDHDRYFNADYFIHTIDAAKTVIERDNRE